MSNWLATQSANRYLSTYFNGFVDISGGQLILRNSDASFNGNLSVGNNLTVNGQSTFVQDATMNGNLTINTNLYIKPGPIKIASNTYTNAPLPSINSSYGYSSSTFASSNGTIYGISGTGPYNLLSSSNQGASWTSIVTSATRIFGLSCSATGQYVIYLDATNVYLSSNYGSSFTNITSRFTGGYIANGPYSSFVSQSFISNDGSTMFISGCVQPGSTMLYVSVNSGQTWNSVSPYAAYISDMVGYGTRVRISLSPDGNIFFLAAWYSQYTGYIMYINKSTLITNYTQNWSYFQYYTGGQNDYDPVSIASNYNGSYLYTIGTSTTSSTITQHTNFNTGSPSATQIRFDNITTNLTINTVAVSNDGTRVVVSVGNYYYISTDSAASFTRYPVGSNTSYAYISGDGTNAYFPTVAVLLYRYSISSSIQIINFGTNAPTMSGANIIPGTIPTGALSGGSSSYVDLTTNQTVGGVKTFSSTITASNGITVSTGTVSLPSQSIADAALSTNIPLINRTNTFTGLSNTFNNLVTHVGGITASATQTINFGTNAPTMYGNNIAGGTIPTSALNNGSGTFVDLTTSQTVGGVKTFSSAPVMSGASITTGTIPASAIGGGLPYVDLSNNQTVGGVKTFSSLLTASGGLTVSGGTVTLPGRSITDGALSTNVALLNGTNTFSGSVSFSTTTPTAPTPTTSDNSTTLATTAYVKSNLSSYLTTSSASSTYATQSSLSSYLTTSNAASTYAPLASPALSGTPTAPTAASFSDTTQIATTAYVKKYFIDLSNNQTVGGVKTFSSAPVMSGASITTGTIPASAIGGGLPYVDLSNNQTIGGTKTFSYPVSFSVNNNLLNTINSGTLNTNLYEFTSTLFLWTTNALIIRIGGSCPINSVNTANYKNILIANSSGISIMKDTISAGYSLDISGNILATSYTAASSPSTSDNSTTLATTAYVKSNLSSYLTTSSASSTYATQSSLSSYLTTSSASSTYAPLTSPALTGTPTAPTATTGASTKQIATTEFVQNSLSGVNLSNLVTLNTNQTIGGLKTFSSTVIMNGNVSINKTTSPTSGYSLDVNGNVIATSYNATSDRRLKDNIEPMESQWSNILSINPVSFDWKLSGKSDTGFIAQDIHSKYPYLKPDYTGVQDPNSNPEEPIDLSGNPLYYAIDYGRMTPFLWKGVQETMREIDSLKKENAELKDLIYGLRERLASLESTR